MKTVILNEPGAFEFTESAWPEQPGKGEVLVKVHRVGICGTDLHAFRGRQPFFSYPRILGHELGVEVVALGEGVDNVSVGDSCAIEPYLNCGHCLPCRQGKTNCCTSLLTLGVHTDGGMREAILIPANKLHPSKNLPLEHLALVEMLCIGGHAVRRGAPTPDDVVLVIGAGPIGLSTIQFAQLTGARVMVMEISPKRMDFCRDNLGVEWFIDGREDLSEQFRSYLGDDMPTIVFDATGSDRSMMNAFNLVSSGGKLVFVGLVQADITFHDPEFHRKELTLMASRNATGEDFAYAIEMLESGKINLEPWITHHASPETIVREFSGWLEPERGVIKAMLAF